MVRSAATHTPEFTVVWPANESILGDTGGVLRQAAYRAPGAAICRFELPWGGLRSGGVPVVAGAVCSAACYRA